MATEYGTIWQALSSSNLSGYPPSAAIDGSESGWGWLSLNKNAGTYIVFDLNEIKNVDAVKAFVKSGYTTEVFNISVSVDYANWTTVVTNATVSSAATWTEFTFTLCQAQWVKLTMVSNADSSYYDLVEVGIKAETISVTYLTPTSATATSEYSGTYVATKTRDDNLDTYWLSLNKNAGTAITFDLGASYNIDSLKIRMRSYFVPTTLDVKISTDNTNWSDASLGVSIPIGETWVRKKFASQTCRYVKFEMKTTNDADRYGISEVKFTVSAITTNIKSINGLAYASIKSINGLAIASVKTINGLA